jgi:NAD(P)H dehydrogenase (quinone)
MRIHIVLAHPESRSFCGAMARRAADEVSAMGHDVIESDLYAEGFEAVGGRADFMSPTGVEPFHYQSEQRHAANTDSYATDIVREQERVAAADGHIFVFPLWWGGMPAILKGWFDRVLSYGFAYEDGMRYQSGYFSGRAALLGTSTGGTERRFSESGDYGTMAQVLWPIQHCMIEYLGLRTVEPFTAYASPRVDDARRTQYLDAWSGSVRELVTLVSTAGRPLGPPPGWERPRTWVSS